MKKTAIALAVAAIVSAPAMAEVKISGNIEYAINQTNADGDELGMQEDEDTDLDVSVSADLGNGWTGTAKFDLEGPDAGVDVNSLALSNAAYGTITLGGAVYVGTDGRLGAANSGDIDLDMTDTTVSYTAPAMGGLSAGITLELNDDDKAPVKNDKDRAMGVGASYTMGNLKLAAGYAAGKGSSVTDDGAAIGANGITGGNDDTVSLTTAGASYAMGALSLGAHIEQAKNDNNKNMDYSSTGLSVGYKLSDATSLSLGANMNDIDGDNEDKDNTDVTVGVSHKMGAVTLNADYGMTTYKFDNAETRGELDLGATYAFSNGWSTGVKFESVSNDGGKDVDAVTTTEIFAKASF